MSGRGSSKGLRWGLALGSPIMAFGVAGALADADRTHPAELTRWVVGAAIVHDLFVLPATVAVAALARRLVGPRAWPFVGWALWSSAAVAAVAFPFVRGYGRDPRIPSLLDRDYGVGLLALLAAIWLIAGAAFALVRRRWHGDRVGPAPPVSADA